MSLFNKNGKLGITREEVLKQQKRNEQILMFVMLAFGFSILLLVLNFAAKI